MSLTSHSKKSSNGKSTSLSSISASSYNKEYLDKTNELLLDLGYIKLNKINVSYFEHDNKLLLVDITDYDENGDLNPIIINALTIDKSSKPYTFKYSYKVEGKKHTYEIDMTNEWYVKQYSANDSRGIKHKPFHFSSNQKHDHNGKKTVRKVLIRNGKGFKSVSHYHKGNHIHTKKKKLSSLEIDLIKIGKFIPGLFKDCRYNKTKKHRN